MGNSKMPVNDDELTHEEAAQESLLKAAKFFADKSVDMYMARNTTNDVYNIARGAAELYRAAMGEGRIK